MHGGGFKNFMKYIGMFFTFFTVAMGFSMHNSLAVLEGHFGKKSDFIRTPKFNVGAIKDNKYINRKIPFNTVLEILFCGYFAFAIYSAFRLNDFGLILFHLMLFLDLALSLLNPFFQGYN